MFNKKTIVCTITLLLGGLSYNNSFAVNASSSIVQLNTSNFDSEVLNNSGISVVLFFAEWCGHCKNLKPKFEQMAHDSGTIKFCAVDCEKQGSLAQKYAVNAFPTVIMFKDGQVVDTLVGATRESITQSIQSNS